MALAAEDFAELVDSMGLAGTAADNLAGVLSRLVASTEAAAAAERALAAETTAAAKAADSAAMAQKKSGEGAAETSKWFSDLAATGDVSAESLEGVRQMAEAATESFAIGAAIVTAYAAALWSLGSAAVALTQEKDALRATFDVFTGGGGDALLGTLEDIAATLPFTGDKLNAWAKSLLAAGISGEALETSLRAVAAATAIMGEGGGAAAEGLIKRFAMMAEAGQKVRLDRRILTQLAAAGVSVQALSKALGMTPEQIGKTEIAADKLGAAMQNALIQNGTKALAIMGDSWGSISAKLSEGWDDAFEDLGDIVGPFMAQLRSLASEFFAGSTAGGVFKDVIKAVLVPAFEVGTRAIRALHIAYLTVLIAFLQAKIYLAPLTDALGQLGATSKIVTVAMYLLAGVAVILAVVLGVLALAVFLVILPFLMVALVIYGVVSAIQYLYGVLSGAADNFDNLSNAASDGASGVLGAIGGMIMGAIGYLASLPLAAAQASADFVAGLVSGISSGAGAVADAVKSLAAGALSSFTSFFGIKSPSTVMRKHGKVNIAEEGLAAGIDEGADAVDAAMADMTAPPKGKGRRTRGDALAARGPTTINFYGPASDFPSFRDQANAWLEEEAASGPEPEPS